MRISVLRLGASYILLTLVVSTAAANTGNNALYMIAALMLGLLVVSGILSMLSLRALAVGWISSGELSARLPASVYVEIKNHGPWPLAGVYLNARPCPPIPARASRLVRLEMEFPTRGLHGLPPLRLESRFPFGFLSRSNLGGANEQLLVYPSLNAQESAPRPRPEDQGVEDRSSRWGEVLDHRGLKPFVEGDDPRHIHWKKSAQRGQTVAVEYDHRSRGSCELFLDTRTGDRVRFEKEVESTASACDRLLHRGFPVALAAPGVRFAAGTGEGHRRRLLEFLALVERNA